MPGFGLGLRPKHYQWILENRPAVDWFEIVSENYMSTGGKPRRFLDRVRERYPLVMHGVGLSIGSSGPLNRKYLGALRELARQVEPRFVTDHLCWTSHKGFNSHDLLPVAYTRESLRLIAERVDAVQEALGRRLFLENPSAYVAFAANEMGEADFLGELCRHTGCGILLDVNNLYVNAQNLGTDASAYLAALNPSWICYFHLAGHSALPEIRVDTHDEPVADAVWELYAAAAARFPNAGTMVEWDDHIPEFPVLMAELDKARSVRQSALAGAGLSASAPVTAKGPAPVRGETWQELQDRFFQLATGGTKIGESTDLSLFAPAPAQPLVGINVYADAYLLRIRDVVREMFPALTQVLGERAFNELLGTYICSEPSTSVSIKYTAAGLSRFLLTCELPGSFGVPNRVLSDIAALEWAKEDIFDAPDSPAPVGLSVLQELQPEDWESVRFDFIAALRLVAADYDVAPVLTAVEDGEAPARPERKACAYLVYRSELEVEHEELSLGAAAALTVLTAGGLFADACAAAMELDVEADEAATVNEIVAHLARWIGLGLVHGIVAATETGRGPVADHANLEA